MYDHRAPPHEARAAPDRSDWRDCARRAASMAGGKIDQTALDTVLLATGTPSSPREAVDLFESLGFMAREVTFNEDNAVRLPVGAVVFDIDARPWIIADRRRSRIILSGPRGASARSTPAAFASRFGRTAVEVYPLWRPTRMPLKIWHLLPAGGVIPRLMTQIVLFSIFLQIYLLASPLLMRILIDEIAPSGDRQLLNLAAFAFGAFALFNAGAGGMRAALMQRMNSLLNWRVGAPLFDHLLHLPVRWFHQRQSTDIIDRLAGLDHARGMVAGSLSLAIDGFLSVGLLVMLVMVAPAIAGLTLLGVATYIGIRLATIPATTRRNAETIAASVDEHTKRYEIVRAIQSIKSMSAERQQRDAWMGFFAQSLNASYVENSHLNRYTVLNTAISALVGVLSAYLGGLGVLDGALTIGVLVAALSYQAQLSFRVNSLFEQFVAWRTLRNRLDRLADVIRPEREAAAVAPADEGWRPLGDIELRSVCFSYEADGPRVLSEIDLHVATGEHVAIVGPSGEGKSTLLKLIAGLYEPDAGQLLLDGRPYPQIGPRQLRRRLGVVLQDDELLSGSILENVSFFEASPDIERAWDCLALADFDDVRHMPHGLHAPVGEAGRNLSGGQRQRILIARALYRQPAVLLMDEATSHLDTASEHRIARHLSNLSITRISIAHHPQTIEAADRVVRLEGGRLFAAETAEQGRSHAFQTG